MFHETEGSGLPSAPNTSHTGAAHLGDAFSEPLHYARGRCVSRLGGEVFRGLPLHFFVISCEALITLKLKIKRKEKKNPLFKPKGGHVL